MNKKPSSTPRPNRSRIMVGGAIAAAVAVAGLIAVIAGGGSSSAKAHEYGTVTVTGAALSSQPDAGTADPSLGVVAPRVTSQSFDGTEATLTPGSSPMLVMFVAHWCPHCQREVPRVTKWLAASGLPADVQLWAVATATSKTLPNYPPSTWLSGASFPVTTLADDAANTFAAAYGLTSYPYFVALDKDGKVVARESGEVTEDQFRALIEAARTGTATPTA